MVDEIETMIAGDFVGAPVSQDDLNLARALVNSGIAGDIEIGGEDDDVGDDLDDIGAEIDIIGAAPPARRPAAAQTRRTVTPAQLRQAVQRSATKMASQVLAARGQQQQRPVVHER